MYNALRRGFITRRASYGKIQNLYLRRRRGHVSWHGNFSVSYYGFHAGDLLPICTCVAAAMDCKAHVCRRPPAQVYRHGRGPIRALDKMVSALRYNAGYLWLLDCAACAEVGCRAHRFRTIMLPRKALRLYAATRKAVVYQDVSRIQQIQTGI